MTEILITLLWLSAAGSILFAVLMLFSKLCRRRVSKRCLYYVWLIVLVRLVVPLRSPLPMEFIRFDGHDELVSSTQNVQQGEIPSAEYEVPQYTSVQESAEESFPSVIVGSQDKSVEYQNTENTYSYENEETSPLEEDVQIEQTMPGAGGNSAAVIVFIIWLTAAGISVIRNLFGYMRFKSLVKRTAKALSPVQNEIVRSLRDAKSPKVFTADVPTPCLVGIIRPCIYIPHDINDDELVFILQHELMHYKCRDLYIKWFTEFVISIHWFNPVMYFLRREITRACELCCDEAVVKNYSKKERISYGNMLINAAAAGRRMSHLTANLCDGKANIKERLVSIMKSKKKTIWTIALGLVLVLVLTGCAVALGLKADGKQSQSDDTTKSAKVEALTEKEKSQQAANDYIKQVMDNKMDNKVPNSTVTDPAPEETKKTTHEPYEEKIVPYDARILKTDKDEYTYDELKEGVLLEIDYELLAEYGIDKYPEDDNKISISCNSDTIIKTANGAKKICPLSIAEISTADTFWITTNNADKGAVRMYAASKNAKYVSAKINFKISNTTDFIITFVKDGNRWVRQFLEPTEETKTRENAVETKYKFLHREYIESEEKWNIYTTEPTAENDQRGVDENGKIYISDNQAAEIALREMHNILSREYDMVYLLVEQFEWGCHVAVFEPGKETVRNGDLPFFTVIMNNYTGQIHDTSLWLHYDKLPTELYPKDYLPKNYKSMSPEKLALWFYEHTGYNTDKCKIVKTEVKMSDRHEGWIDCVILYRADGNSYEVDFMQMAGENCNVPIDIWGVYSGTPTH